MGIKEGSDRPGVTEGSDRPTDNIFRARNGAATTGTAMSDDDAGVDQREVQDGLDLLPGGRYGANNARDADDFTEDADAGGMYGGTESYSGAGGDGVASNSEDDSWANDEDSRDKDDKEEVVPPNAVDDPSRVTP